MTVDRPAPAAPIGAAPLIAAKLLAPPPRAGLVARPALLAQLDACRESALTILSAPAGYGKTTLLAAWLAERAGPQPSALSPQPFTVAWLALDADDAEPARFWAYVLAALRRALPGLPGDLAAPLRAPQPNLSAAVTALANALAALPAEVVLVLDDYHTITSLEVHRSLAALLERRPPGLHLMLAGRADPPLPLARLRAQGLVSTLRAADLRFSRDEAAAFLTGTMGLALDAEAVAALEGYTEGWPAGLQLAALWLRDHPEAAEGGLAALAAEDRYLVEFLAEEVLQRQSPELQRFLLDTALLDRLCPELCDYVTADARRPGDEGPPVILRPSAAILEELERRNLFVVPLDAGRAWYRYHNLFADTLRRQLGRQLGQAAVARLHRRAAGWFAAASTEDASLLAEAQRHAAAGRAYDLAADLILPRVDQLAAAGQIGQLIAWLAALPEEALAARPALALRYAWVLFLHGRQDEAARWLEIGEGGLAQAPDPEPLTAALPEAIRAAMATTRHDAAATLAHVARAAALLPPDEPVWSSTLAIARGLAHHLRGEAREAAAALGRAAALAEHTGDRYGRMISCWHLAQVRLGQARLAEAARAFRRIAPDDDETYGGYRDVGLARVAYDRDDLPAARALAAAGLQALEAAAGQPRVIIFAQALLARLARAAGDPDAALAWLDAGEALARRLELAEDLAALAALRAELAVADGDLQAAEEWAAAAGLDPAAPDARREAELLTLARALIARGRDGEALRIAGALLAPAEAQGRGRSVVECELVRALALAASGQTPSARAAVATALAIAGPEGLARPFRDAGPAIAELVESLRADPRAADPATPLARGLAALAVGRPGPTLRAPDPDPETPYEALSERELRVLALIAADCSNQEIASALIVSVNTVKTHIKRIYEKLQVNSRVGAVARGRELGLCR